MNAVPDRSRVESLPRHPGWGELAPRKSSSGARYAWVQAAAGSRVSLRVCLPLDVNGRPQVRPALEATVRDGPSRGPKTAACELTWDEMARTLGQTPARAAATLWDRLRGTLGPFPEADVLSGRCDHDRP
jgi:hypothetical protein